MKTLLQILDRTPPYLCRMMAIQTGSGKRTKRMPEKELIRRSGLSRRTIIRLSYMLTWTNVTIETASRFSEACGVKLAAKNPMFYFFRHNPKGDCSHLTNKQKRKLAELKGMKVV